MPRPRILLVPHFSELDWRIKPLLEEWARVASFDAPGVGHEPPPDAFTTEAVVERGVAELDRAGVVQRAEHRGCLLFTPEGYEEAVAAFPEASHVSFELKPAASPEFAETLRSFCHELSATRSGVG